MGDANYVKKYLKYIYKEHQARGALFPQDAEEHKKDYDAIHRIWEMIDFYAERGVPGSLLPVTITLKPYTGNGERPEDVPEGALVLCSWLDPIPGHIAELVPEEAIEWALVSSYAVVKVREVE